MKLRPDSRPDTLCQHLGEESNPHGAVIPPIFQNTLFVHESWDSFEEAAACDGQGRFHYSRMGNPTLDVAERKIAALEGTDRCRLLASGMAAISCAIMACVKAGSHVICVDGVYGPTRKFLSEYLPRFGIETTYVVGEDPENFVRATRPETSLYFLESPGSLIFRLQDLAAVAAVAKERGICTAIDNSFSSPIHQQPAKFGIDYVCHTVSKYLGGHSDVIGGALCCSAERMRTLVFGESELFGASMSPFNAWLVNRSMRTLGLRVRAAGRNATLVANWLRGRPEVARLFFVGSDDFPQAGLRDRQMTGVGGLLAFEPRFQTREEMRRFTEALRLFQMGVSWGGHESLAVPLELQPMDWPEKRWIVRLYCGLEDPDDLIGDLEGAFSLI
ncbi:MAG: PLP-dependent transferase [Fimbriimonadaceae bacterium]|nr:PLP-dependent transferase [Fimbriimonadaceae bacterium]QYK55452.1 MAG: PLP-dependent transferase [Fimbriimonadaceae bacterium]